jgi:hypothetical protein
MVDTLYAEEGLLPGSVLAELGRVHSRLATHSRRRRQAKRLRILKSQHASDIAVKVADVTRTRIREEIVKHVSTVVNPAADVVDAVCAVWKNGAVRRLLDASETESSAFAKLVLETGFDAAAPELNQVAYFVGPVMVLPMVRKGRMRLEYYYPQTTSVVLDTDDPMGPPVAFAYEVANGTEADLAVVDGVAHRFFSNRQGRLVELTTLSYEHGIGFCPGVPMRFEPVISPEDWWVEDRHQRLEDGAIDVGRTYAALGLVRRNQNKKLMTAIGDLSGLAKGQSVGDPEVPVTAHVPSNISSQPVVIDVKDFDTDPRNFHVDIRFALEAMASSTGVATVVDAGNRPVLQFDHEALTELRNKQIAHARIFESALWRSCIATAKAPGRTGRPAWSDPAKLPKPDVQIDLQYRHLSRRYADPEQASKHQDWMMGKGAMSPLDLLAEQHPTLTEQQLREMQARNIEDLGHLWEEVAKRNATINPDTGSAETLAQQNGRLGTPAREAEED